MKLKPPPGDLAWLTALYALGGLILAGFGVAHREYGRMGIGVAMFLTCLGVWLQIGWAKWLFIGYWLLALAGSAYFYSKGQLSLDWKKVVYLLLATYTSILLFRWKPAKP